jgi:hypothetical protein
MDSFEVFGTVKKRDPTLTRAAGARRKSLLFQATARGLRARLQKYTFHFRLLETSQDR